MTDATGDLETSVTVLFADISGSTAMYADRGDRVAYQLTSRCILLLEEQVRQVEGRIIKRLGDAILAAFETPDPALRAAAGMQQAFEDPACDLRQEGLHVRIGIASGTALLEDGDVFGDIVNVAARLVTLAGSDEILIAATTYEALPDAVRDSIRLIDTGVPLRGRAEAMGVYEYVWHDRPDDATVMSDRTRGLQGALELRYGGDAFTISAARPKVTIGRDGGNDITIAEPVVSRHHAYVTMRGDKFLLVDRSTNGTYVLTDAGDKFRVTRDELTLTGSGRILPGSKELAPIEYRTARA